MSNDIIKIMIDFLISIKNRDKTKTIEIIDNFYSIESSSLDSIIELFQDYNSQMTKEQVDTFTQKIYNYWIDNKK